MTTVKFDLNNSRAAGNLVKENTLTIWAKIVRGGKSSIIKRHKIKHDVKRATSN